MCGVKMNCKIEDAALSLRPDFRTQFLHLNVIGFMIVVDF